MALEIHVLAWDRHKNVMELSHLNGRFMNKSRIWSIHSNLNKIRCLLDFLFVNYTNV